MPLWLQNIKIPSVAIVAMWMLSLVQVFRTGWIQEAWKNSRGYVRKVVW